MAIVIEEIIEGGIGDSATSVTVTAPTVVNSGDLLIFGMACDGGPIITENTSTDWTELENAGGSPRLAIFYMVADGSEDSEAWTFDISISETAVYQMIRLSNWHGTTPPEISAGATGNGNVDCDSVTASWGAEDANLFIAFGGLDALAFTAGPSGYSNFGELDSSSLGASGSASIAIATIALNQATEDPGVYTNGNDGWQASTVVVRPGAAAEESLVSRFRRPVQQVAFPTRAM